MPLKAGRRGSGFQALLLAIYFLGLTQQAFATTLSGCFLCDILATQRSTRTAPHPTAYEVVPNPCLISKAIFVIPTLSIRTVNRPYDYSKIPSRGYQNHVMMSVFCSTHASCSDCTDKTPRHVCVKPLHARGYASTLTLS